jgi:hypothetical protein
MIHLSHLETQSNSHPLTVSLKSVLILFFRLCLGLPINLFLFHLSNQNPKRISQLHASYKIASSYPRLDHYNNIWRKYELWTSSFFSFLLFPVTSPPLLPNTVLGTLFSNVLNLYYHLNAKGRGSRAYKRAFKIIFLHILILCFRQQTPKQNIMNFTVTTVSRTII